MILCASPDYLRRRGTPVVPADLATHEWLAFGRDSPVGVAADGTSPSGNPILATAPRGPASQASSQPAVMALDMHSATGERHRMRVEARVASNNQISLQQMCEHGLGLARLAHADVAFALARGTLVRVLPQWRFAAMPVWAVTPRRDESEAAKVRGAVEHLKCYFGGLPAAAADAAP